jgi:hypothetical protein
MFNPAGEGGPVELLRGVGRIAAKLAVGVAVFVVAISALALFTAGQAAAGLVVVVGFLALVAAIALGARIGSAS